MVKIETLSFAGKRGYTHHSKIIETFRLSFPTLDLIGGYNWPYRKASVGYNRATTAKGDPT